MIDFLLKLIAIQGGAIVHSSDCGEDELEEARRTGRLAIVNEHAYVYRGKVWLANANYAFKQQMNEEAIKAGKTSKEVISNTGTESSKKNRRSTAGYIRASQNAAPLGGECY